VSPSELLACHPASLFASPAERGGTRRLRGQIDVGERDARLVLEDALNGGAAAAAAHARHVQQHHLTVMKKVANRDTKGWHGATEKGP
jgi:CO dehydrogenase/acetyl-CoA synthase alpha subunit